MTIQIKLRSYFDNKPFVTAITCVLSRIIAEILIKIPIYSRYVDRQILLLMFFSFHGRKPLKRTFSGELFSRLIDEEMDSDLVRTTTDKELVKSWIASKIGCNYCLKTLAILENKKQISDLIILQPSILKPAVGSGEVMYCDANSDLDKKTLTRWLGLDFYKSTRQRNYKDLPQRIIVEELAFQKKNAEDIKFFCVEGRVRLVQWDFDRHVEHTRKFYTPDWETLQFSVGYPMSRKEKHKPRNLHEMVLVAEKLAEDFDFVRIDMFCSEGHDHFYVGEITHCHGSSFEKVIPEGSDHLIDNILFG